MNPLKVFVSHFITSCLILMASVRAQSMQQVFIAGENGYACFRIPAMVTTTNGVVLAFAEARKNNCGDAGNIDLVMKRSLDSGKSWSPMMIVWDDAGNTCGNPAPVVDQQTGKIILLSTWNLGSDHEPQIIAQTSTDTRRIFVLTSMDDGLGWSAPRDITSDVKLPNWTWYATGPCNGIQLKGRKYRNRLVIPCDHIEAISKKYFSHTILSDDGGTTWRLGGSTPEDQVNESTVAELPDGRLMLNMRNYNATRVRQVSYSMDGGSTWSLQQPDFTLVEPVCQGSLLWWQQKGKKPALAFSNPASQHSRTNMTVRLSYDQGKTWPLQQTIHEGPSAYSNLVALPGGRLACYYEGGEKTAYEGIVLRTLSLSDFKSAADPSFSPINVMAMTNARLANQAFNKSVAYVKAWMQHADAATGLIPRNLRESKDFWNAWDAGADNYPFMVLVGSILMPEFFENQAVHMLDTERKLTSRIGYLPDNYSFSKKGFQYDAVDTARILFGSAEYMKDGLMPLTEWLGESPWSARMIEILDDLPRIAEMAGEIRGNWYGNSATVEVNGDLLQVLSRMYWFTGNSNYLDRAIRIADHYLTPENLPTHALDHLRIRDHGCEIISGLCEAYLAVAYARPEKRELWRPLIHRMMDRILEVGRNEDGLFYDEVDPRSAKVLAPRIADNFGYTFNAYWFLSKLDSIPAYREAVIKGLSSLRNKYRNFDWENGSADGYADAIEGALNLYNREPLAAVKDWLDSEIKNLWNFQKADGMIEGWHGDGNFARTSIMYGLWKTQGVTPVGWKPDLMLGAERTSDTLLLVVSAPTGWQGELKFDVARHRVKMHFPVDYPRINQFPEWFVAEPNKTYMLVDQTTGKGKEVSGQTLINGIPLSLKPGEQRYLKVF